MLPDPVDVVRAWHDAFNSRDADALTAASDEAVEIVTMHRGTQRGHEALRGWVERQSYGTMMNIVARRLYARDGVVAIDFVTEWRDAETGELVEPRDCAAVFEVRDGRVARVTNHPDAASALAATGLGEEDAVDPS